VLVQRLTVEAGQENSMSLQCNFSGQVALVTGASAGIGLATAKAFAQAGASVVLADLNEGALRAAVDDLQARDARCSR
jgi:NAD(P)-dependent dehydrogenase (short-subunit alcohol dehydrogenase family)